MDRSCYITITITITIHELLTPYLKVVRAVSSTREREGRGGGVDDVTALWA